MSYKHVVKETVTIPNEGVHEPKHYKGTGGMQSIDVMKSFMSKEAYRGFLLGNVIKYVLRYRKKNGVEDLEKAQVYLRWLVEEERESINEY